jgi:hypothetical protein
MGVYMCMQALLRVQEISCVCMWIVCQRSDSVCISYQAIKIINSITILVNKLDRQTSIVCEWCIWLAWTMETAHHCGGCRHVTVGWHSKHDRTRDWAPEGSQFTDVNVLRVKKVRFWPGDRYCAQVHSRNRPSLLFEALTASKMKKKKKKKTSNTLLAVVNQ